MISDDEDEEPLKKEPGDISYLMSDDEDPTTISSDDEYAPAVVSLVYHWFVNATNHSFSRKKSSKSRNRSNQGPRRLQQLPSSSKGMVFRWSMYDLTVIYFRKEAGNLKYKQKKVLILNRKSVAMYPKSLEQL